MASALPDTNCPLQAAQIHDGHGCMLNQVDIGRNENKFYQLQVIKTQSGQFFLWKRWGRVGQVGQHSLSPPGSQSSAISAFRKGFKDKTGLSWEDRDGDSVPGCYTYMRLDVPGTAVAGSVPGGSVGASSVGTGTGTSSVPATDPSLDGRVSALVGELYDQQMMTQTMSTSFNIDVQRLPLGKINAVQLNEAEQILKQIEDRITLGTGAQSLEQLSSRFWTLVPQASKNNQRLPVVDTLQAVARLVDTVDTLRNIQVAVGVMQATSSLHQLYASLGTRMTGCDDDDLTLLRLMLKGTTSSVHGCRLELLDALRLHKPSQDVLDRSGTFRSVDDHRMLFHGSRTSNMVSIIKDGFRIPRPDQVMNGSTLGRGVYFADCCTKSSQYCSIGQGQVGYMLVCEVALGTKHVVTGPHATGIHPPFHSRVAKGTKTVDYVQGDDRVWYPTGPVRPKATSESSTFQHNEFVISDANQYRFRYILKVRRL
jgi:predicted DNA-binding WGR domain protein